MRKLLTDLATGFAWELSRLFPVHKNRILFSHFYGRSYGDSPRVITEALIREDPEQRLELVWLAKDPSIAVPERVKVIPYQSIRRIFYTATSGIWIDDCRKGARFKKKNQFYLQTWHGFAMKRIEFDVLSALPAEYKSYAERDSGQIDLMVSGSRFMSSCYRSAFHYSGEILEAGSPRNDILFHIPEELRKNVYHKLNIPEGYELILYAPTFRADGTSNTYAIDAPEVIKACEHRFGEKFVFLVRLHPNVAYLADQLGCDGHTVIQATDYPDIQDLLAVSAIVISDYSSLMFDFGLTGRPCFQFALDISDYKKDRNFYFAPDSLPFPLAESNRALSENILSFDPDSYHLQLDRFFSANGFCENGNAAEVCADRILQIISN